MTRRPLLLPPRGAIVGVLLVAVLGTSARVASGRAASDRAGRTAAARADAALERDARARAIVFYERRVEEDPTSALDLGQLAGLYLQRARELGDESDLRRGEDAARRSFALRESHNGRALVTLASSLLAQHRFVEARDAAARAVALDPDEPIYRALLGETQLELGDYAGAKASFAGLHRQTWHLSVGPRLVRFAEVAGRGAEARWLAGALRDSAARRRDLPREQLAWFHLRVGDLEARAGRWSRAVEAYESGLDVAPDDVRLLAALARAEGARGRWRRAVERGDAALAAGATDPATLALLSDAWRALGDSAQSEDYARAVEATAFAGEAPLHRAWAVFLLDRGRRVPEVLARAERELAERKDVYGWDLYAWALHRAGRHAEADAAMARAIALGTEDVQLAAHARDICAAMGRKGGSCPKS